MLRKIIAFGYIYAPILLASNGHDFLLLSISEHPEQHSKNWANTTTLICQPSESPFFSSSSKKLIYKYEQVALISTPEPFRDGFFKSTCFLDPIDEDSQEFCIFFNPTVSNGQGMVIVAPEEVLEGSFEDGLDLSEDPPHPDTIQVVEMPEKGGKGAVASRDVDVGEDVAIMRPVGLFPTNTPLWSTSYGRSIRRQAIDHLPMRTRAAIARLYGEGESEDEFISSVIDVNTFTSFLKTDMDFGAVVLEGSRLNHACRPNVIYSMEPLAQLLHLKAIKPIAKGEELTISYRSLDLESKIRHESLEEFYGFDCRCSHCQMRGELRDQSDRRVSRIAELQARSRYNDDDFSADEVEEFVDICKKENIPPCMLTASMIAVNFYNSVGETKRAKEHAKVAMEMGLLTNRISLDDINQIELILNPPKKQY